MGVTQQEIAGQAGVSPTTVSLVLNGRAEELNISPECARRVLDTARKLGYRSNYHARALARGKATTLGFVNRADGTYGRLFGHTLSSGVERRARELGYDLLLFGTGEKEGTHLTRGVEGLVEKRVDALLVPYFHGHLIKHDRGRRWPMMSSSIWVALRGVIAPDLSAAAMTLMMSSSSVTLGPLDLYA